MAAITGEVSDGRVRLDIQDLVALKLTIERVIKNGGYVDEDALIPPQSSYNSPELPQSKYVLNPNLKGGDGNARYLPACLELLQKNRALFKTLDGSTANASVRVRRDCNKLNLLGISRLPDEVLADVFKLCVQESQRDIDSDSDSSLAMPTRLSRVSQRFRTVSINTPHLWTMIHTRYSPKKMQIFQERSQFLLLTIYLDFNFLVDHKHFNPYWGKDGQDEAIAFVKAALRARGRWGTLVILSDRNHPQLEDILPTLQGLSFPQLKSVELTYEYVPDDFASWKVPRLEHLRLEGTNLVAEDTFHRTVQSCQVYFRPFDEFSMNRLLDALSQPRNLTRLLVDFITKQKLSMEQKLTPSSYMFRALKHLDVRISGQTKGDYNNFVSLINAPELQTLTIDFTAGSMLSPGGDGLGEVAWSFGKCTAVLSKLRCFVLRLTGIFEFEDYDIMGEFFKRMPNLEELEVHGANPKVLHWQFAEEGDRSYPWVHYPSLRRITINLQRITKSMIHRPMHPPYLTKLVKVLKSRPTWRNFERFELGGCTEYERPLVDALSTELAGKAFEVSWTLDGPAEDEAWLQASEEDGDFDDPDDEDDNAAIGWGF